MDSQCEIMWEDNSGAGLGRQPTADYWSDADNTGKKSLIAQQRLRTKKLIPWIRNSLNTYMKRNLRAYKTSYDHNSEYDGDTMLFVDVKMIWPDTFSSFSDSNANM